METYQAMLEWSARNVHGLRARQEKLTDGRQQHAITMPAAMPPSGISLAVDASSVPTVSESLEGFQDKGG